MNSIATVEQASFIYENDLIVTGYINNFGLFYPMCIKKLGDKQ